MKNYESEISESNWMGNPFDFLEFAFLMNDRLRPFRRKLSQFILRPVGGKAQSLLPLQSINKPFKKL